MEYLKIRRVKASNIVNDIATPVETVRMTDKEIIKYLEEKVNVLEKTISNLKEYCGEEYILASQELEEFLRKENMPSW